ncbi:MAG: hypothetical protein V8Q42_05040 [Anaerovoracaceae bacterium]
MGKNGRAIIAMPSVAKKKDGIDGFKDYSVPFRRSGCNNFKTRY